MSNIQTQAIDSTGGIKGAVKLTFTNVETGEQEVIHILNVFVYPGKCAIAARLAQQQTNQGKITYMATGTGTSVPGQSDIHLHAELFRKAISVFAVNSNVATFTTFYSTTESNGVITEIGLFGDDATATNSSGTMYAHTTVSKTKTSSDTLTIEWAIVIN